MSDLNRCVDELIKNGKKTAEAWAIAKAVYAEKPDRPIEDQITRAIELAKKNYALPETFDIPAVEIFAVGKWNGDTYSENDLDEMVKAFQETKSKVKPYLKLGHGEEQSVLRADELPAAGWITDLRRLGKKLIADFTRVPRKIYDLLRSQAYRRVSSEIYWNYTIDGKKYPRMLKAVALLGGETPAVHDLEDIIGLYSLGGDVSSYATDNEPKTYEVDQTDLKKSTEDFKMADPLETCNMALSEANKKLSQAASELEKTQKKNSELETELKTLSDKNAVLVKENSELKTEKHHTEIRSEIDKLINDKKIVPAQKEMLFTLLSNLPESSEKTYSMGDKKYSSLKEVALAFVETAQKPLGTDGETHTGKAGEDLEQRANRYAAEHKVDFKDALLAFPRTVDPKKSTRRFKRAL